MAERIPEHSDVELHRDAEPAEEPSDRDERLGDAAGADHLVVEELALLGEGIRVERHDQHRIAGEHPLTVVMSFSTCCADTRCVFSPQTRAHT